MPATVNSKPPAKGGKPNATPPAWPPSTANPLLLQRDQIRWSSLNPRCSLEGKVPVLAEPIHNRDLFRDAFCHTNDLIHHKRPGAEAQGRVNCGSVSSKRVSFE